MPGFTSAQTPVTQRDAVTAYRAFNTAFYSPQAKLYQSITKRDGVAAIWVQAIYRDMAMDVYERTKGPAQLRFINDLYEGNGNQYAQYDWTNHEVWFIWDDMMWWIMALARAHELTGNPTYLAKSIEGFSHIWQGSYDPVDGGMFRDFKHSGKNGCINYLTVIAAMRLYTITGDTTCLNKAKSVYSWSRNNLFDFNEQGILKAILAQYRGAARLPVRPERVPAVAGNEREGGLEKPRSAAQPDVSPIRRALPNRYYPVVRSEQPRDVHAVVAVTKMNAKNSAK